jgi:hypothetical protein
MSSAALVRALAAERDALRLTTAQQLERLQRSERKLRDMEAQQHRASVDRLRVEARKVGIWLDWQACPAITVLQSPGSLPPFLHGQASVPSCYFAKRQCTGQHMLPHYFRHITAATGPRVSAIACSP